MMILTNVTANGTDGAGGFKVLVTGLVQQHIIESQPRLFGGTTFYNIPSATAIQLELGLIMVSLQLMVLVKCCSCRLLTVGLPAWQIGQDLFLVL